LIAKIEIVKKKLQVAKIYNKAINGSFSKEVAIILHEGIYFPKLSTTNEFE